MKHEKFHYQTKEALVSELARLGIDIPLTDDLSHLAQAVKLGKKMAANAIVIQPMEGCDGTADGRPDTLTNRRYDRFARSGAGMIWAEAVAIVPEGRANPRQLWLTEDTLPAFERFVAVIKETCIKAHGFEPIVIMQATHSGRYSKPNGVPEPIIAYNNPMFEGDTPIAPSRIITDEQLFALEEQYGAAARLAERAGFDGVDIKCCHRYLNCELLSAFERKGAFGGSFDNRTRLLRNGVKSAQATTGTDFLVTSRLSVYDGFAYPYGWGVSQDGGLIPDLREPIALAGLLHNELDMAVLNVTIGNPYVNPHVNRPYDMGGYLPDEHPLEGVARMVHCVGEIARAHPTLKVISSGLSYLRQLAPNLAAAEIAQGVCAMAGFGRKAFAYPDFAQDILQKGALDAAKCCITCSKCTELMRAGSTAGCVIRDPLYVPIYQRDVLKKQEGTA